MSFASTAQRKGHPYIVTVTIVTHKEYGVTDTQHIVYKTWAVSEKKAISNVKFRRRGSQPKFESPYASPAYETYLAERDLERECCG